MLRTKILMLVAAMVAGQSMVSSPVQAGPLLDWFRGVRQRAFRPTLTPQYSYYAPQQATPAGLGDNGTNTANISNLQPGQCLRTCQRTCSRTVVNYVPYTAYRTCWNRVPVTQYRPVTSSDPCTGCTMTCMKPCTTYTYQAQRVPYTTYRPVYRQETYQVPVTTVVNDCNTGTCPTCPTAAAPGGAPAGSGSRSFSLPPAGQPGPGQAFPGTGPTPADAPPTLQPGPTGGSGSASRTLPGDNSLYATGSFSSENNYESAYQVPAGNLISTQPAAVRTSPHTAARPQIRSATQGIRPQSAQRPFLNRFENQGSQYFQQTNDRQAKLPPRSDQPQDRPRLKPLNQRWSYTPVRLARHTRTADTASSARTFTSFSSLSADRSGSGDRDRLGGNPNKDVNSAWQNVD